MTKQTPDSMKVGCFVSLEDNRFTLCGQIINYYYEKGCYNRIWQVRGYSRCGEIFIKDRFTTELTPITEREYEKNYSSIFAC
jgi:hypothetical protein